MEADAEAEADAGIAALLTQLLAPSAPVAAAPLAPLFAPTRGDRGGTSPQPVALIEDTPATDSDSDKPAATAQRSNPISQSSVLHLMVRSASRHHPTADDSTPICASPASMTLHCTALTEEKAGAKRTSIIDWMRWGARGATWPREQPAASARSHVAHRR